MNFTEKEILEQLDLTFKQIPTSYYPQARPQDIKYNFFLDLEHGYRDTAGSRIHLYADTSRWIIVFESSGYQNRRFSAEIQLDYVGNCIDYPVNKYPERNYITNSNDIILIESDEYERISNKMGSEGSEQFELISPEASQVNVRNVIVQIEHDEKKYNTVGIKLREYENPQKLISFSDIVRYLHETDPKIISATEDEIKKYIPKDITKIMTIERFHFSSVYDESNLPSKQETYQLLAKVLASGDKSFWKPTLDANNHWSNWESGHL